VRRFLASIALVFVAAASILIALVSAATITGTSRADRLTGTMRVDVIDGRAGDDVLSGLGGDDLLLGGPGRDTLSGGLGADRIAAHSDGSLDTVRCGAGVDVVNADRIDSVAPDCEVVSRQLSTDTTKKADVSHATEVEPDSFAWGSTVVAAYQVGRSPTGGAAATGFSTSSDGGRTWRSGLLPGLTTSSPRPGTRDRVSDPVVGFDALHGVWLVASLGISNNAFELLVSRSPDGRSWAQPVLAVLGPAGDLDKEWIACDNWPSSPFRGRCYLSYLDASVGQIVTRYSVDGGLTWSPPARTSTTRSRSGLEVNGAQPLPRPDGSLVVVYVTLIENSVAPLEQEVLAARSDDGGATFGPEIRIASLQAAPVSGLRSAPLPSTDVDAAGRLYATWQECPRPEVSCVVNRMVLATSSDGLAWSEPTAVGTVPSGASQFLPGLAVDQAPTAGPSGPRLAVVYYTLPGVCSDLSTCPGVDVWLAASRDGGATWGKPQRLNGESIPLRWLARTNGGFFLGDYVSTSFVNGQPVSVFALAAAPARGALREAIFALTPRA
jgi:hypothetical protein